MKRRHVLALLFFFSSRRRHTRSLCDWSSDVCSSDLAFGGVRSARRGVGSDIASTREYHPGDDVSWMDWAASARLSAARGTDEFIVRERFADEAPRVVVVVDRRATMSIGASALRRLDKP